MKFNSKENTHSKGDRGEKIAANYLINSGYEIIDTNWRIREGELDIIAKIGQIIVFIEVKTAHSSKFGSPIEWVDSVKQSQIGKLAEIWIDKNHPENCSFQFDVIGLTKEGEMYKVEHLKDAFRL